MHPNTISHYQIIRKLGAGGMGEVYLAEDTNLRRKVAIKFLPVESVADQQAKKRLIREAQAAATLDHPNICTIHEVGEEEGKSFIVMQYVEGETLSSKIQNKPLQLKEALDVAMQMADALAEAHLRGIIHRDIKSQNIMITPRGQAKVMDFGLAKVLQPHSLGASEHETVSFLTELGTVLGTVPYMSPEQLKGEEVDARSDLFSFGAVLYEMISGRQPFAAKSTAATISAILTEQPPPLDRYAKEIPEKLQRLVCKCLQKDREERYQSAKELLHDLKVIAGKSSLSEAASESSPSIAVLPFVNMSADPQNEYFCDGLAEELINALTKIERLRVVARASAFSFKGKDTDVREIGQKLNVGAVLEGSVRKAGNRLRITAQLINVADGYHLWSERYDRQMEDIFDIQDEISLAIGNALKVKLLGAEKAAVLKRYTENAEAHELYLKGRYFWLKFNPEGWMKARECFEQALQKDSNFALAYSGLADALTASAVFTRPKEVLPKAREMALQALKLDPNMAEAWGSESAVRFFYEWDWAGSESASKKSIDLNPRYVLVHDLYSLNLLTQERFEDAIGEARRACELDPLSAYYNASLGFTLYFARQYDEARDQLLKGVELDPGQLWSHIWLVDLYEHKQMYSDALHHRQKILTLTGNSELAIEIGQEFKRSGYQSALRKCLDDLLRQSQFRYVSPVDLAAIHVQLDEQEKALEWLEKAFEERTWFLSFLKIRPTWESLHSYPRFNDLVRRMGL